MADPKGDDPFPPGHVVKATEDNPFPPGHVVKETNAKPAREKNKLMTPVVAENRRQSMQRISVLAVEALQREELHERQLEEASHAESSVADDASPPDSPKSEKRSGSILGVTPTTLPMEVLMALEEKILLEQQSNRFETSTERKTLIIFDWDDTLFPSTWLRSEWKPLCRLWFKTPLKQDDNKRRKLMRKVGILASRVLEKAKTLGEVVMITNAQRPWLTRSADLFMEDIVPSLTKPPVPVYYAMETMKELEYDEDEADIPMDEAWEMHYTEGKRRCMSQQVEEKFAERMTNRNIISIGDGVFEQKALAEVRTIEENRRRRNGIKVNLTIKTLRLLDCPSLDELCEELTIILNWLPKIVEYGESFDMSFESQDVQEIHDKLFGNTK